MGLINGWEAAGRPGAKERPILFSGPMVRAILEGRKTQTRRVLKAHGLSLNPLSHDYATRGEMTSSGAAVFYGDRGWSRDVTCPYGQAGDRLWVRETWCPRGNGRLEIERLQRPFFAADPNSGKPKGWRWRPSIHMPRWASRIALEVTEIRVQRLQEISEEDAKSEGIERSNDERWPWRNYDPLDGAPFVRPTTSFMSLWNSINGAQPGCLWMDNPWVWAISFRSLP